MDGSAAHWLAHDSRLLLCALAGIACIIVLISLARLPPFLSILVGTFVAGLGIGLPASGLAIAFGTGAGHLLGDAGLIIALGAMLGAMLTATGAADRIASTLLALGQGRRLPWVMALVAMVIGLPLFFEVGLVMMVPLIFVMARQSGQPVLRIAVPALAGMTTLHALVPPHPGPLIAVGALHADLGLTMAFGVLIAIPAVVLAGPLYGSWLARHMQVALPATPATGPATQAIDGHARPGFVLSLGIVLLPVVLMLGATLARVLLPEGSGTGMALRALGQPLVALALAVLASIVLLGWGGGLSRARVNTVLAGSLPPVATLLLTIGAGGGLQQVLLEAGISHTISKVAIGAHLPYLLLAWLIAVALRQATGSATVATSTTAGILAPLVAGMPAAQGALIALAIGAGSVFFCHVNDAGFWMVREYFTLTLKQTVMMWSVLQTLVSLVGLAGTALLWQLFA